MSNVPLLNAEDTAGDVSRQLGEINAAFGATPAMFRAVANSSAALSSMWGSFGAFADGALGSAVSEQLAVAVANKNSCDYCLAAHTLLGKKAGVSAETMSAAQTGESDDPRIAALLAFALLLVEERGQVAAEEFETLRTHGWSDEQIVETIAQVALNVFTNYINIALDVPVDFPMASLRRRG
jgi:uncharacterized peroxidase-related enzyme